MDFPLFSLDTSSLEKAKVLESEVIYDLLTLGEGPSAMSAAVYAARKMLKFTIIIKEFGGQVCETSQVKNWLGFQAINAKDLVALNEQGEVMVDCACKTSVEGFFGAGDVTTVPP